MHGPLGASHDDSDIVLELEAPPDSWIEKATLMAEVPNHMALRHEVVIKQPTFRRKRSQPIVMNKEGLAALQQHVGIGTRENIPMVLAYGEKSTQRFAAGDPVCVSCRASGDLDANFMYNTQQ